MDEDGPAETGGHRDEGLQQSFVGAVDRDGDGDVLVAKRHPVYPFIGDAKRRLASPSYPIMPSIKAF